MQYIYADEADLLNIALFGITAKEWWDTHPNKEGNIRDEATLEQLVVLSNLESINALLIRQGLSQAERLLELNKTAITQMKTLIAHLSKVLSLETKTPRAISFCTGRKIKTICYLILWQ